LKAVSLLELSVHDRLIWLEDAAEATRPLGAAGSPVNDAVRVRALATFE
jgi:hypothetical protein